MTRDRAYGGISFDLFGTLVAADRPADPSLAVAAQLESQGVPVPADWSAAYAEPHLSSPGGVDRALADHVAAALASRGVTVDNETRNAVDRAIFSAFETPIRTLDGATEAVEMAAKLGPVGVLSNCSVHGLVRRTISASDLDRSAFDAIVSSVDCGWRKPDPRAFEAVATVLGVELSELLHVGDNSMTDGGAAAVEATSVLIEDVPLGELPSLLDDRRWE